MSERTRQVGSAALLLAASVLLSRVLGYGREAVLAAQVGVGAATDAYKAAFQIPDLLNYFLAGGALSIPFIPLYTRYLERRDEEGAARALGIVFGTVTTLVALGTIVLFWQADALVGIFFHEFDAEQRALTVRLTRIVLPGQIFFFAGGILRAALMARGSFAAHAAAPLLYNLSIIAGGLWLEPRIGVEGFSWGCLVGAVLGPFLVPLIDARRRGLAIVPGFRPLSPEFLHYARLLAPLCLGATLLTVDEWFDRYFAQFLGTGAIAVIFYARVLMQIPIAAVGQAVATAALPVFSRLWSEQRVDELNALVQRSLELSIALAILLAAGLHALAEPAVRLLYERGAFSAGATEQVVPVLRILIFGVAGWVAQQIAVRAFYAREQMWTPMLLGTGVAVCAVPLYWWLGRDHGVSGLAAAGAIAVSANALATLLLARLLHGGPGLLALSGSALRATVVAVLAAWAVQQVPIGRTGTLGALTDSLLGAAAFAVVALPGAALLVPALRTMVTSRLRRGRPEPSA